MKEMSVENSFHFAEHNDHFLSELVNLSYISTQFLRDPYVKNVDSSYRYVSPMRENTTMCYLELDTCFWCTKTINHTLWLATHGDKNIFQNPQISCENTNLDKDDRACEHDYLI